MYRLARKSSGNRLPDPVTDTEMPDWALADQAVHVRAGCCGGASPPRCARELDLRFAVFLRVIATTGARRGEVVAILSSSLLTCALVPAFERLSARIEERRSGRRPAPRPELQPVGSRLLAAVRNPMPSPSPSSPSAAS